MEVAKKLLEGLFSDEIIIDDRDLLPLIKKAIKGIANEEAQNSLTEYCKRLYAERWLSQAVADEDEPDLAYERHRATREFERYWD